MSLAAKKDDVVTAIELQLGKRISRLRSVRGITQDRLALLSGFTKGYLSKIENSKVIPPIGTLIKIAQILNTDVADLLEREALNDDSEICIVRSWQREPVVRSGTFFGRHYVSLASKRLHKQLEPFIVNFQSEIDRDLRFEQEGEEFMFILSGEVEFEATVNGRNKTWILAAGDSAYFDSRTPHRGRSLHGDSRALVVCYCPKTIDTIKVRQD